MDKLYDMSAGSVKIDAHALQTVLACAAKNSRTMLERGLADTRAYPHDFENIEEVCSANFDNQHRARYVARYAREYADALSAYHAITEFINGRALSVDGKEGEIK